MQSMNVLRMRLSSKNQQSIELSALIRTLLNALISEKKVKLGAKFLEIYENDGVEAIWNLFWRSQPSIRSDRERVMLWKASSSSFAINGLRAHLSIDHGFISSLLYFITEPLKI